MTRQELLIAIEASEAPPLAKGAAQNWLDSVPETLVETLSYSADKYQCWLETQRYQLQFDEYGSWFLESLRFFDGNPPTAEMMQ